ncbi:MAG: TolC family protein [Bacteroidota bacterium]
MRRRFTNAYETACRWLLIACGTFIALPMAAQNQPADSLLNEASLEQIIQYALVHQPALQQAQLDKRIIDKQIAGRLADWYPQLNFVYNYQRNIILQQSVIAGNVIKFGANNLSALQLNATQNIFNRDVVLASETASNIRTQADFSVGRSRLDVVVNTTKAFYDLLATIQQIRIGEEDIIRLKRSLKDATSRYNSGIADKTDPKRAQILLANSDASLKSYKEQLDYKKQFLKAQIGYPVGQDLSIIYDTLQMEKEIQLDTTEELTYASNVDYRIQYINRELQNSNVKYAKWSYVPAANLFGSYIYNFQNNAISDLYATKYPYFYIGGTLSFPIFQGFKRAHNVQQQKYTLERQDWELTRLKNNLNTEYSRSLAAYKSSLARYLALKQNVDLAREVYDVIQLQYKNGVRAYLDVTVAETDLQTARINYFNALYSVLASKMDVLRAKGETN